MQGQVLPTRFDHAFHLNSDQMPDEDEASTPKQPLWIPDPSPSLSYPKHLLEY